MRFILTSLLIGLLAVPAYALDTSVQCLPEMSMKQCYAWQKFWPDFQSAIAAQERIATESAPTDIAPGGDALKKWNKEHDARLSTARGKVAELTRFPFLDGFRSIYKEMGLPVTAGNAGQFVDRFEYIFKTDVKAAIAQNKLVCTLDRGEAYSNKHADCNSLHLTGLSDGIGLEFEYKDDGRYYLIRIPYVE